MKINKIMGGGLYNLFYRLLPAIAVKHVGINFKGSLLKKDLDLSK